MKLQDLLEEVSAEEYKQAKANREALSAERKEKEKSDIMRWVKHKVTTEMRKGNDEAYFMHKDGSGMFDDKDLESRLRDIYTDFIFSVKEIMTGKKITWQLKSEMPLIQKKEGLVGKFFRKAGGK